MILFETYELLKKRYPEMIRDLSISEVRVGLNMTAVVLSDGSAGVASTVADNREVCKKSERYYGDFSPGKITGKKVSGLFDEDINVKVASSLRLACLNAISSTITAKGGYNIIENADPIDLLDLQPEKTITIVGAFHSYIKKIAQTANKLQVLELNEDALDEKHKHFYVPASEYRQAIARSQVVIITGFTLVNGTIGDLLQAIKPGTKVIVVGPSGNLLPDILFEKGVNIIGATRITDPGILLDVVGQGGTGFHLFENCARKICIVDK